jgi:inner membrane transporter RhtA
MRDRVPPHAWFVVSAVFHYLGPAFAVLLFARVEVLGVAWLRIASAAVVFAIVRRPRFSRDVVLLGVVLAVMNACFYEAIDRLPLGTVAAIEFVGVIVVAVAGMRSGRNLAALALAAVGVFALTGPQLESDALGLAFAAANAALFATYVVVAHRVSRGPGVDGLAGAMLVAAAVATPIGGWAAAPALLDPVALAAGVGVGVCSSVIPYVADQLAMARLPRPTYALLVSLLPATATVVGAVVLAQVPSVRELAGVALVVAAVALHREPVTDDAQPRAATTPPRSAAASDNASSSAAIAGEASAPRRQAAKT